jgi:hypothetical protein
MLIKSAALLSACQQLAITKSCQSLLLDLRTINSETRVNLELVYIELTHNSKNGPTVLIEKQLLKNVLEIHSSNLYGGYVSTATQMSGIVAVSNFGRIELKDGEYLEITLTGTANLTATINTIDVPQTSNVFNILRIAEYDNKMREIGIENTDTIHFINVPEKLQLNYKDADGLPGRMVEHLATEIRTICEGQHTIVYTDANGDGPRCGNDRLSTISVRDVETMNIFPVSGEQIKYIYEYTKVI